MQLIYKMTFIIFGSSLTRNKHVIFRKGIFDNTQAYFNRGIIVIQISIYFQFFFSPLILYFPINDFVMTNLNLGANSSKLNDLVPFYYA